MTLKLEDHRTALQAAVEDLLGIGLSFFPCGKDNGKKPIIPSWKPYRTRAPSHAECLDWLGQYPDANVALVTGNLNGITVLDCDDPSVSLEQLEAFFGDCSFVVKTSRGYHLYYRSNGETNAAKLPNCAWKGEVRGEGG